MWLGWKRREFHQGRGDHQAANKGMSLLHLPSLPVLHLYVFLIAAILIGHFQMSLLPSVQPFHAMAFPIDPTLALEIRWDSVSVLTFAINGNSIATRSTISWLLFCFSKKYADHYSLVALRFGLPAFSHPSCAPIKTDDKTPRLRIGYIIYRCYILL